MREIKCKYRGKSVNSEEWVYGVPVKVAGTNLITLVRSISDDDIDCVLVRPDTIGECIGIKDCETKELYEDDILQEINPRGNIYKVFRVEGGFAINTFQDERISPTFFESLADMQNNSYVKTQCKKIGNIHDNPELMQINK